MALQLVRIENGQHHVGNSVAWEYIANESGITFKNAFGVPDICVVGNFLGDLVVFKAEGRKSAFLGKAKLPKDKRLAYLWKKGFRRSTRIEQSNPIEVMYKKHGGDEGPSNPDLTWTYGGIAIVDMIKRHVERDGVTMFESINGRIYDSNNTDCMWYMNPYATIEEVMSAFNENPEYSEYVWDCAEFCAANKYNIRRGNKYYIFSKTVDNGTTLSWLFIGEKDGEIVNPNNLNNIDYERKFGVAYSCGKNKNFDILAQVLGAKHWETKDMTAAEKFAKNKEWCIDNNLPEFIPPSGKCFSCGEPVFSDGEDGPDWDEFITGCPHCCRTFCD